jgi:hypothetical protein
MAGLRSNRPPRPPDTRARVIKQARLDLSISRHCVGSNRRKSAPDDATPDWMPVAPGIQWQFARRRATVV